MGEASKGTWLTTGQVTSRKACSGDLFPLCITLSSVTVIGFDSRGQEGAFYLYSEHNLRVSMWERMGYNVYK
jgi:hypothetical protein